MCVSTCVYMGMHVGIRVCEHECVVMCICVCTCVFVYGCACVDTSVCACVHLYVCSGYGCVHACECTCVCACVCVIPTHTRSDRTPLTVLLQPVPPHCPSQSASFSLHLHSELTASRTRQDRGGERRSVLHPTPGTWP